MMNKAPFLPLALLLLGAASFSSAENRSYKAKLLCNVETTIGLSGNPRKEKMQVDIEVQQLGDKYSETVSAESPSIVFTHFAIEDSVDLSGEKFSFSNWNIKKHSEGERLEVDRNTGVVQFNNFDLFTSAFGECNKIDTSKKKF